MQGLGRGVNALKIKTKIKNETRASYSHLHLLSVGVSADITGKFNNQWKKIKWYVFHDEVLLKTKWAEFRPKKPELCNLLVTHTVNKKTKGNGYEILNIYFTWYFVHSGIKWIIISSMPKIQHIRRLKNLTPSIWEYTLVDKYTCLPLVVVIPEKMHQGQQQTRLEM